MPTLTLEYRNYAKIAELLTNDTWIIACLCAAWCDTCNQYRSSFEALALRHTDKHFVWIDIEDQAEVVGDLDVENFPTLLIQRGDIVAFFGTVQPDIQLANRLLLSQTEKSTVEICAEAISSAERRTWQENCNLRERLKIANQ